MNYDEMSKDEVLAIVENYRIAGVADVPEFTTKKDAVAWLAEAEVTIGTVNIIEQGEGNPSNYEIVPPVVPTPPEHKKYSCKACKTEWEGPGAPDVCPECSHKVGEPVKPAVAPEGKSVTAGVTRNQASVQGAPQLYYMKKAVLNHHNKIVNGRIYVEIVCADQTTLLTQEEFTNNVGANMK